MRHGRIRGTGGRKGFTLVELLIIIGIISILFAVTLIAVDPARRFQEARDAVRRQDVRNILEAIVTYVADNRGNYPNIDNLPNTYQLLGTNVVGCNASTCAGIAVASLTASCADLSSGLVETYLAQIPTDPNTGSSANTRYYVNKTSAGRVEVGACDPERVTSISVKR